MSPFIRDYLISGLENNARVVQYLLCELPTDSPRFDVRVEPERFTLREIVAHLNDYDAITRERFEHIIREEKPEFPDWEPGEAATHYENRDPRHGVEQLLLSRRDLAAWLKGLTDEEWQRKGTRPRIGEFSVEDGVAAMLGHDAYHLQQIVVWLEAML